MATGRSRAAAARHGARHPRCAWRGKGRHARLPARAKPRSGAPKTRSRSRASGDVEGHAALWRHAARRAGRGHPARRAGLRKIVLATTIAETSLTIDGIDIVIDSGLKRVPRFDPRKRHDGARDGRVSQASADQRRGRAGRQGPGICLQTMAGSRRCAPSRRMMSRKSSIADLAPLALELAQLGCQRSQCLALPRSAAAGRLCTGARSSHRTRRARRQGRSHADGQAHGEAAAASAPRPYDRPRQGAQSRRARRRSRRATCPSAISLGRDAGADIADRLAALRRGAVTNRRSGSRRRRDRSRPGRRRQE